VKPSVARILFASGANEYQAAKEQPEAMRQSQKSKGCLVDALDSQNEAHAKKNTRPCLSKGLMMGNFCALPFRGLIGGFRKQRTFFMIELVFGGFQRGGYSDSRFETKISGIVVHSRAEDPVKIEVYISA
jgi:hypothetical protein